MMAAALGTYLFMAIRASWVTGMNCLLVPCYVAWMFIFSPMRLYPMTSELYWKINGFIYRHSLSQVALWCCSAGYTLTEVGDDISECAGERTVFLCNHQSTFDVPALMNLFTQRNRIAETMCWVMDIMFRVTHFGIVSALHGDFFIQAGAATRHLQPKRIQQHIREVFLPRKHKWIILFPEGGFLCNRKKSSQRYAEKHGLPHLQHVALPRVTAMHAVLEALGEVNHNDQQDVMTSTEARDEGAKWVIDATLMYPRGEPLTLTNLFTGNKEATEVFIHYKKHLITTIPRDQEEMAKWLYKAYEQKDKMLAAFYESEKLPEDCVVKRPIHVDIQTTLLASIAFGVSSLAVCQYFISGLLSVTNLAISSIV